MKKRNKEGDEIQEWGKEEEGEKKGNEKEKDIYIDAKVHQQVTISLMKSGIGDCMKKM